MGSNPTVALALVALLTALRFLGEQIKEVLMSKKYWKLKSKTCGVKRTNVRLASIVAHFFETVWATGAGVAGAMVISTFTH